MHCNFICGLSDVIDLIKTFSQSVSQSVHNVGRKAPAVSLPFFLILDLLLCVGIIFSGFCRKVFRVNLEYAPFTGAFNQQIIRLATIRLNAA